MDADLSHPPEKIPEMLAALADGADPTVGSRFVEGGTTDDDWGLFRWLNSRVATLLARPLTPLKDPTEVDSALTLSVRWGALAVLALLGCAAGALLMERPRARLVGALLVLAAIAVPAAGDSVAFAQLMPRPGGDERARPARAPGRRRGASARIYRPRVTSEVAGTAETLPRVFFETAAMNTASRFGRSCPAVTLPPSVSG